MSEPKWAAVGTFLRRTGGLKVRFDDGKAYVRVPTDWLDDLDVLYKDAHLHTESEEASWRDAARRLHESGDDEPYATDDSTPETSE